MEVSEWAGQVGAVWAKQADGLDKLLGPMGDAGLAALGEVAGLHVLDLGCGAGASTMQLAERGAEALGVDISPDLIARATERAKDAESPARFLLSDAAAATFETPFDRLFSRFGAMFFPQPRAAFENLRKAMKPGGQAMLVAWTDIAANTWMRLPAEIGRKLAGDAAFPQPDPSQPGPFAWDNAESFVPMLKQAGWADIELSTTTQQLTLSAGDSADPVERAVTFCLKTSPQARRFYELPDELRAKAPDMLAEALSPFLNDDAVQMPGKAWLISMRA